MNNIFETDSPAGNAINSITASKSYVVDDKIITTSLTSLTSNTEIPSGCVFVISEGTLGQSTFGSNILYEGSTVQAYCQNLYHTNLGLTDTQKALIKPQDFVTNHTTASQYCTSTNQYIF